MQFLGGKRAKNDLKLSISVCFALYLRNFRSYHQDFDNDIYRCFSLYFFQKCSIVNIKIILLLLAYFNSFFNNNLFFKFIKKCQKEIFLRCAPPSSYVCDFQFLIDCILVWQLMSLDKKMVMSSGKFNFFISLFRIYTHLTHVLAPMKVASTL